jgi:hypothetical protein
VPEAVRHGTHILCDTPGCEVFFVGTDPSAYGWEVLEADDGQPAAHLCRVCAAKKRAGVLGDPAAQMCSRCGRTSADGVVKFWSVPAPEESRRHGLRRITVCDRCNRFDDSWVI